MFKRHGGDLSLPLAPLSNQARTSPCPCHDGTLLVAAHRTTAEEGERRVSNDSNDGGGCGCLGAILGLGLLSFFSGRQDGIGYEDGLPPWQDVPPPEFLEDSDGDPYDADFPDEFR